MMMMMMMNFSGTDPIFSFTRIREQLSSVTMKFENTNDLYFVTDSFGFLIRFNSDVSLHIGFPLHVHT